MAHFKRHKIRDGFWTVLPFYFANHVSASIRSGAHSKTERTDFIFILTWNRSRRRFWAGGSAASALSSKIQPPERVNTPTVEAGDVLGSLSCGQDHRACLILFLFRPGLPATFETFAAVPIFIWWPRSGKKIQLHRACVRFGSIPCWACYFLPGHNPG